MRSVGAIEICSDLRPLFPSGDRVAIFAECGRSVAGFVRPAHRGSALISPEVTDGTCLKRIVMDRLSDNSVLFLACGRRDGVTLTQGVLINTTAAHGELSLFGQRALR